MSRHKYLERLINKHLPSTMSADPAISSFLDSLNEAFHAMERDRQVTEHAFNVSEREYQEALRQIDRENRERRRSMEQLEKALSGLLRGPLPGNATSEQEHSIELLRQVIDRGKLR